MRMLLALSLIFSLGCGHVPVKAGVSVTVPLPCVSKIERRGCDLNSNPLRCKSTLVTYRSGCEEVNLGGK